MAGRQEKALIGFVGLGMMGLPMVQKLQQAGHRLVVWNREPEAYDQLSDVLIAENPRAVAEQAGIIFLCVLDDRAVDDVVFGQGGIAEAANPSHLIVDHSTGLPVPTQARAEKLKSTCGADWVDAPVSGGPGYAREGKLTIMAGGEPDALARAAPFMDAYAGRTTLMGPVGAGQTAKVINQAICGVGYVLMAEVHRLATQSGLAADRLPQCLAGGHADSALLRYAYPKIDAQDFVPVASKASQMAKDLKNVEAEIKRLGLALPIVQLAKERYADYVAAGHGDNETASISELYK
ncbi:NAD(P)-dependent oxidoreductase [Nitratireductor kimnyeongensis]|uniref:NAD(P)-dependent oxidoreductase n=1 Tax=Nitratireductor kimnyeongensis TaxID=430679 RepID=A0ABW0TC43_9HYPH|nr:NAD(P)-dependent oxidoreductase [Nitratireductor kimnyeongensis]QZZ36937.1 NAD(P)-dependent oxidoreductase [Nitratireductor kimnyeongensis]